MTTLIPSIYNWATEREIHLKQELPFTKAQVEIIEKAVAHDFIVDSDENKDLKKLLAEKKFESPELKQRIQLLTEINPDFWGNYKKVLSRAPSRFGVGNIENHLNEIFNGKSEEPTLEIIFAKEGHVKLKVNVRNDFFYFEFNKEKKELIDGNFLLYIFGLAIKQFPDNPIFASMLKRIEKRICEHYPIKSSFPAPNNSAITTEKKLNLYPYQVELSPGFSLLVHSKVPLSKEILTIVSETLNQLSPREKEILKQIKLIFTHDEGNVSGSYLPRTKELRIKIEKLRDIRIWHHELAHAYYFLIYKIPFGDFMKDHLLPEINIRKHFDQLKLEDCSASAINNYARENAYEYFAELLTLVQIQQENLFWHDGNSGYSDLKEILEKDPIGLMIAWRSVYGSEDDYQYGFTNTAYKAAIQYQQSKVSPLTLEDIKSWVKIPLNYSEEVENRKIHTHIVNTVFNAWEKFEQNKNDLNQDFIFPSSLTRDDQNKILSLIHDYWDYYPENSETFSEAAFSISYFQNIDILNNFNSLASELFPGQASLNKNESLKKIELYIQKCVEEFFYYEDCYEAASILMGEAEVISEGE